MQRETAFIFLAELGGIVTKDLGFEKAKDFLHFIDEMIEMIREPEIIRCRDCRWKGNSYKCRLDRDLEEHGAHRTDADDDWYCADGTRNDTKKSNCSEIPNS